MKTYKAHKKKWKKVLLITGIVVIGLPVLVLGTYATYVLTSYSRIGDKEEEVSKKSSIDVAPINQELSITSFNIGFGAYSDEYSFFLDQGINPDGSINTGYYGKGISREDVLSNTYGCLDVATSLNSDFYVFQEVDKDSNRSYHVDQNAILTHEFKEMDSTYVLNYNSAYLFYPLYDPHGKSIAGLNTFSKYSIESAERKEYKVADDLSKLFDLDRCFCVNKIKTSNDKYLVLINSHMSAYDEGGKIRNEQLKQLYSFMKVEYEKGNYIVCGGDFNHDLLTNNPMYPEYNKENYAYKELSSQLKPDWVNYMFDDSKNEKYDSAFTIIASDNEPSCRGCDLPFTKGVNFLSTVDGFIISPNVEFKNVTTTRVGNGDGFEFSDHQPTTMTFKLKI